MNGLSDQFVLSLRLYFRNRMGLFYGYLFPAIFLAAFWVLYRTEPVPLSRHLGELLTVTALGGACLGMPTTIVNERERGVWRRYRLTPVSTRSLVISTMLARYLIVITAGLLQLALAMAIGMPLPKHPLALGAAYTFVSFAFLGLGLVIAALADNVPAVQALGQCIFLPMLIIGGIAVQPSSLPDWAQHVAAFFPGRYAVDALRSCVTGNGLWATRFNLVALALIGAAGCLAGAKMFRWDAQQRFAARSGKGWLLVALAAWAVVGVLAEYRGSVLVDHPAERPVAIARPEPPAPAIPSNNAANSAPQSTSAPASPGGWQGVTVGEINRDIVFDHVPADSGVVAPIALLTDEPSPDIQDQLNTIAAALPGWAPGRVADPVQRVRNLLSIPSVADVKQLEELEGFIPLVVFDQIRQSVPKADLIKILYWIATHPADGDQVALDQLAPFGLAPPPPDIDSVRDRVSFYSVKLLGRLLGKITQH